MKMAYKLAMEIKTPTMVHLRMSCCVIRYEIGLLRKA